MRPRLQQRRRRGWPQRWRRRRRLQSRFCRLLSRPETSRWSNPRPLTAANQASAAAAEQERAASVAAEAAKAKFKETIEAAKAQRDSKTENREAPQ